MVVFHKIHEKHLSHMHIAVSTYTPRLLLIVANLKVTGIKGTKLRS